MKKLKFLKLRMIWAIIRGRTVVYNANLSPEGLQIRNEKGCCVVNCTFDKFGLLNPLNQKIVGG